MSERLQWEEMADEGGRSVWWADAGGACCAVVTQVGANRYAWKACEWVESDDPDWQTIDSGESSSLERAKRKARELAVGTR